MRPYLPLNHLRAFEAAARHGSFARAATELRVTPAALGHQVKALEERLGRPLFNRLSRGLSPTDEGADLLPVVEKAMNDMAAAIERLGSAPGLDLVSVSTDGAFAIGWLLPRLADFRSRHPNIEVRVFVNDGPLIEASETCDLMIRFEPGGPLGNGRTVLIPQFSPLCAPDEARRLVRPASLERQALLSSPVEGSWVAWFREVGITVPPIRGSSFTSLLASVEAARRGLGVAIAPTQLFEPELDAGELVQPFPVAVRLGAYRATLRRTEPDGPVLALLEWLRAQASDAAR